MCNNLGCVETVYHKKYIKDLGVACNSEINIRSRALKKSLVSASFDHKIDDHSGKIEALTTMGMRMAEMSLISKLSLKIEYEKYKD